MTEHPIDRGTEAGRRASFAKAGATNDPAIGRGDGYSGQEYDAVGQHAWREAERAARLPTDGQARGSGAGAGGGAVGEDYDETTPGGARPGNARVSGDGSS